MSLFDAIEENIDYDTLYTESSGFEMDPNTKNKAYKVTYNNNFICESEFQNNKTENIDDIDVAQSDPDDYIVNIFHVKNHKLTEQYIEKLQKMGFSNIIKNKIVEK